MKRRTREDFEGTYILQTSPSRQLTDNNQISWSKIENFLNSKFKAEFSVLSNLVEDHVHGTKTANHGYQFVIYCIKSGWLKRILK